MKESTQFNFACSKNVVDDNMSFDYNFQPTALSQLQRHSI